MGKSIVMVGLGGAAGSILRYLSFLLISRFAETIFPVATFSVNFLGSFLIGLLIGFFEKHTLANGDMKLLLVTGFCGGFTTFSTFALDNINLLQSGHVSTALSYSLFSFLTCIAAVWLALLLMK